MIRGRTVLVETNPTLQGRCHDRFGGLSRCARLSTITPDPSARTRQSGDPHSNERQRAWLGNRGLPQVRTKDRKKKRCHRRFKTSVIVPYLPAGHRDIGTRGINYIVAIIYAVAGLGQR